MRKARQRNGSGGTLNNGNLSQPLRLASDIRRACAYQSYSVRTFIGTAGTVWRVRSATISGIQDFLARKTNHPAEA